MSSTVGTKRSWIVILEGYCALAALACICAYIIGIKEQYLIGFLCCVLATIALHIVNMGG